MPTTDREVKDFQKDVLERSHTVPVLVDFWADWCGPCKTLGPVLERLASDAAGQWVLVKINTDAHQELAATYGIRSIPNVKLFIDGDVADEFVGALPEYAVRKWLESALPGKYRKDLERAAELIRGEDLSGAQAILKKILSDEPQNEQARVMLAQTLLFGIPEEALSLTGAIEEHSQNYPLASAISTLAKLLCTPEAPKEAHGSAVASHYDQGIRSLRTMDFGNALRNFIEVVRLDRSFADDGGRKACVAIFRFLGDEHPVTREYRRAFSSALY